MADARPKRSKKQGIHGQWMWQLVEMKESPAWRELSLSARKLLDRIEIELAHHGGDRGGKNLNGALPVTYGDFVAYRIDRHAIAPAINEAVALGFLEVTEQGCAGNEVFRRPNKYRLTYRFDPHHEKPTDEWREIKTDEEAALIARTARRAGRENRSPVGVRAKPVVGENPTTASVGKTHTTAIVAKPTLLSISRVGGARLVAPEHEEPRARTAEAPDVVGFQSLGEIVGKLPR